ncbi:MAG: hypothetical protein HY589_04520, partial [Candidatus Omnitrophica bacterium]|nr:hypothetical protein [Candidatus Omnitrophota bacterium]
TARDEAMNATLSGVPPSEQPAELAPININVKKLLKGDEYVLARALHLYNQRMLNAAKSDLKDILIETPDNRPAAVYFEKINSAFEARQKPKETLEAEIKGIASVEQGQLGHIYGREEFGNTEGREKFTTNTAAMATRISQNADDLTNKFISEGLKLEGSLNDYKYTATANINYYNKDNKREDIRLRGATWWMQNEKVQLMLGDTSTHFSRYVLNGVNYRGINVRMDAYQSMFGDVKDKVTILYGQVPYFYLNEDEYIYPRQIVGLRNEMDIWTWWEFNTSLAYILDSAPRVIKLDPLNKAKENALLGIDQVFRIIPGIWTFTNETALNYADDDREVDNKILRSWATYFVSDFKTRELKIYNSYERVDPDFRTFTGLTGYFANKQVSTNKEHVLNFIEYNPYDEVDLGLQYSKTRTNLDKSYNVETVEENNYKANLKISPTNGLPRFSLRGSIWTSTSNPGTVSSPKEQSNWDTVFEVAKTYGITDVSAAMGWRGYSQFINESNSYGDALERSFTLSANRKVFDRITITPSYTFLRADLKKKPNRRVSIDNITSHLFDLSVSSPLWDTAALTLDYNFSDTEDFATPGLMGSNNAFTTTFSWPFTTTLGFRKKFVFSPYLSYHVSGGTATFLDRDYFSGRLEGDYFLTENTKFNLSGEYRDNTASDPAYLGFGDEYRIMLTYKTVSG